MHKTAPMNKRILFVSTLLLAFTLNALAQNKSDEKTFTQQDWDKLSQASKDSINKELLQKFEAAKKETANTEEANANQLIDEALKNSSGTTSLTIANFPKTQLREDITKLKNLEEFSCLKCRQLDLNTLFNQLAQLPKLKSINLSGGTYKTLPNSIKKLPALEVLNLKDNNFTTLPDSFTYLKNLRVLNLEHNPYLYDEDVFERIKTLNIEDLNFSASGLLQLSDKIGEVKSLKKLNLSINDIKTLPPSFSKLNLAVLSL